MKLLNFFYSSNRRISLGLGIIKFLKTILSLFVVMLSAKFFGTSEERDAWILGGVIISVIIQVLFGPINETFRAKYVHLREEYSKEDLVKYTDALITLVLLVAVIFSFFLFFTPNIFAQAFAPGFSKEQQVVLLLMIKFLVPSLLIIEVTDIWSSMLNAYNSFYLPDIFSFFTILLNVVILIFLAPIIGIYSLVISSYISSILLLVIVYRQLYLKFAYRFKVLWPKWSLVKPFILFSVPFYINYIFSQTDIVIEKALSSKMSQGSISILDYAKKFSDLPINMLIGVITTVLTPVLALAYVKKEIVNMVDETQRYFRMISLVIIPLTAVFMILPHEIVTLVLLRGAFKAENVEPISSILRWYGLGIFITGIYIVYSQILIAQKKIHLLTYIIIGAYTLKIIFNVSLFRVFNLLTFPISWVTTQFIISSLMVYFGVVEQRQRLIKELILFYIILLLILGVNYSLYLSIQDYFSGTFGIIILVFLICISILIFEIILIFLFKIEERKFVSKLFLPNGKKN
ncbi:murein biosynthesis integral membrane protein MurJ [Flavobacterium fluviatile]|uniref:murein biosynthesis integral membrane protein MurJ n=1 Tax=Flavobacterium fluviatile TaxID=1862387 RepID=UPI0013D5F722|nr:lipid II flippase MurJ [Flavobacterium fluviatile]